MNRITVALTVVALGAVLFLMAVPGLAKEDNAEAAKDYAEFKRLWAAKTYVEKLKGLAKLPGGYERATKDILDCLNSEDWVFRQAPFMLLYKEKDTELLGWYEEQLFEKEKRAAVMEHMVWALYNNEAFANAARWARLGELIGNVKKVDVKVRGRAAREMGKYRGDVKKAEDQKQAKDNFLVLLGLLEKYMDEKKPDALMIFQLSDAMENLTGQEHGNEVKSWRNWWDSGAKDRDLIPRQADKLTKDLQEIQLEEHSYARKRGRMIENLDVLVLPDFGWSGQYWQPYICELNKIFACYMVSLPDASRVKPEPKRPYGNDAYVYPLPQLVEAFEKRREASQQKKVGIIAHGISGWIALQYARQRPDSVAFIIVISTWSGTKSFNSSISQLENNQNPIIKYFGAAQRYDPNPTARVGPRSMTEEQNTLAHVGSYKSMHLDPYALEPLFYALAQDQFRQQIPGVALVPDDFEFKKGVTPIDVPAMIIWGAKDWRHVKEDQKTIPEAFKNPTLALYENSYRVPWAEEPVRFVNDVKKMVEKYGIGKEDNKKGGK
ncbi:MAG: alpha/beta hydrolase [Planctomycetes bacterium]|nr:alpha/beta hydrolase [Planctomycetota bacterium]